MERKRTVVGSGIVCVTERQAIPIMEKFISCSEIKLLRYNSNAESIRVNNGGTTKRHIISYLTLIILK